MNTNRSNTDGAAPHDTPDVEVVTEVPDHLSGDNQENFWDIPLGPAEYVPEEVHLEKLKDESTVLSGDEKIRGLVAIVDLMDGGEKLDESYIIDATSLFIASGLEINTRYNKAKEEFCRNSIYMGKVYIGIQKAVKDIDYKWTDFAEENFPSTSMSSIYKRKKLAKFPGAINYARFGFEGLLEIISALKGREKESDPIGKFLTTCKLNNFEQDMSLPIKKIQLHVKAGLLVEKAQKSGLLLTFEDAKAIAAKDIQIDFKEIKETLKSTGGKFDVYIKNILQQRGGGRKKDDVSLKTMTSKFHSVLIDHIDDDKIDDAVKVEMIESLIKDLENYKGIIEDDF